MAPVSVGIWSHHLVSSQFPWEVKFASDSPVEEGVTSELVSEAKFPASREFTGNFIESGLGGAPTAAKKGIKPKPYRPIPYASEQGIFYGLAGNLNRRSGKFPPSSGNPALVRYLGHFALPTDPIYRSFREISTVCREGKEGRRQMLASPSPPLAIPSFASRAQMHRAPPESGARRFNPAPAAFSLLPCCLCTRLPAG